MEPVIHGTHAGYPTLQPYITGAKLKFFLYVSGTLVRDLFRRLSGKEGVKAGLLCLAGDTQIGSGKIHCTLLLDGSSEQAQRLDQIF